MKGILLISSGIDSPVAGWLMLKKGVEIVAVHMDNQPLVNEKPRETAVKLVSRLSAISGKKIKMYIVNHGKSQKQIV